jgi:uncharacterized membrane protein YeaQ/YmgE (transglycosylase-associated protein family)
MTGTQIRWPTSTDYTAAVQRPDAAFGVLELQRGTITMTPLGMPAVASGQNVVVFRADTERGPVAIRCFVNPPGNGDLRYAALERHIAIKDCESLSTAAWIETGITTQGRWWPIVLMPWETGRPLNIVVEDLIDDPASLRVLAEKWCDAVVSLQAADIAHGDLQHGNVLVESDLNIRFVDLDGIWVPEIEVGAPAEHGHPNYQHPGRASHHWGANIDSFSAMLILLSLRGLAADSGLERFLGGENLLFTRADLVAPGRTEIWARLAASPDPEVVAWRDTLLDAAQRAAPPLVGFAEWLTAGLPPAPVQPIPGLPPMTDSLPTPSPGGDDWWSGGSTAAAVPASAGESAPSAVPSAPKSPTTVAARTPSARPAIMARLSRNATTAGLIGGLLAGLVGAVLQGAIVDLLPGEAATAVFVVLVAALLGAVLNGFQDIALRGIGGASSKLAVGAMVGAVAGLASVALGDLIVKALLDPQQVTSPPTVALTWVVAGLLIGGSVGALRSPRAMFAGMLGGNIGGLVGGLVYGFAVAEFENQQLIVDGLEPATIGSTMLVCALIGGAIGMVGRVLRHGTLSVIEGRGKGVEVVLSKPKSTIGAAGSSNLVVRDDAGTVHNTHATISMSPDGRTTIIAHGHTLLDGDVVTGEQPLRSGGVLTIGSSFIRFDRSES